MFSDFIPLETVVFKLQYVQIPGPHSGPIEAEFEGEAQESTFWKMGHMNLWTILYKALVQGKRGYDIFWDDFHSKLKSITQTA